MLFTHHNKNCEAPTFFSNDSTSNEIVRNVQLMPSQLTVILLTALLLLSLPVAADSLVIPDITAQPPESSDTTPRPTRSMTMEQVREEFGAPEQTFGPVGEPPITRWIYNNFTVTFEGEYVIHSAAKRNQ